jgi:hypothetical protein
MGGAAPLGELVQHAAVSVVALGALAVVLRRVLGVFESRPAAAPGSAGTPHASGPSCSHGRTGRPNPALSPCPLRVTS